MKASTVRLQLNVGLWLRRASLEELYVLARELRGDLGRRGLGAELEAGALECALVAELLHVEKASDSADCTVDRPAASSAPFVPHAETLLSPPPRIES